MLYESAVVGAFNYLWGYHDAKTGVVACPCIVSNAQNFLDALIGDLIAQVNGRFFLIEFKSAVGGFYDEVHGSSKKPARTNQYALMRGNGRILTLSKSGHFACWPDGDLVIEGYGHAPGPGPYLVPGFPHILNSQGPQLTFDQFYDAIQNKNMSLSLGIPETFSGGPGLTANGMLEYIESLVQSNPDVTAPEDSATAIFGFYNPETFQTTRVPINFEGLLESFRKVKALKTASSTLAKNQMSQ